MRERRAHASGLDRSRWSTLALRVGVVAASLAAYPTTSGAAVEISDPAGDAIPIAGRSLDLREVDAEVIEDTLSIAGVVTAGTGAVDPDFEAGALLVPGATARALYPVYRVSLDLDQNQATGISDPGSGVYGAEVLLDVTAGREFPHGDPALGVRRTEPFLAAFFRRFSASGSLLAQEVLDVPVERNPDGFTVDVPLSTLIDDGNLDLRVSALLLWAGGACTSGGDPTVCFSLADAAPGLASAPAHVAPALDVELTVELESEKSLVSGALDPQSAEVVYADDGEKAFLWRQNDAGSGAEIRLQLFDGGEQASTLPLLVNESAGMHALPTAGFDGDGNVFVFWREEEGAAVETWEGRSAIAVGSSVLGRRFDRFGAVQGGEVIVNAGGPDDSQAPAAATDGRGDSLVTWRDSDAVRVRALRKRVDCSPCIVPLDFIDPLSFELAGQRASVPQTAASAGGDFVVVWLDVLSGKSTVLGRLFDAGGTPKGAPITITDAANPSAPSVGVNDRGEFVVAWESGAGNRDVMARRYRSDGTALGNPFRVNESASGDQRFPRVDVNAKGTFAVVWQDLVGGNLSVLGRMFRSNEAPLGETVVIAVPDADSAPGDPDIAISNDDEVTVAYERRRGDGKSKGLFRRRARLAKKQVAPGPGGEPGATCATDDQALCLGDGRFRVTAFFSAGRGPELPAHPVAITGDTGFFWFFDSTNVEVVIKLLDGCSFNDRFWVYAAGLTDVAVRLEVEDLVAGAARTYTSAGGAFQPIRDTSALDTCDAGAAPTFGPARFLEGGSFPAEAAIAGELLGVACANGAENLCLAGSRFRVEVRYDTGSAAGVASAVPLTADTGYFWFFDDGNVEVVLKVLQACDLNARFWVFAAGLTDVGVSIEVVDTESGESRTYSSALGAGFAPIQDTDAFRCIRAIEP